MTTAAGRLALFMAVAAAACAVGLASARSPRGAVGFTVAVVILAVAARRGRLCWWDLYVIALGGALVLTYGFANVGLTGRAPVPLADVIGLVLFLCAALTKRFRWPSTAPFTLAALFVLIAFGRLVFDVPTWGKNAFRDFTLAFELVFMPIGYWAYRTYGRERWVRAVTWIFVTALIFFLFYPWRDTVGRLGPTVGLQRPVPLLEYAGAGVAAATGLFFFALVRPFRRLSYVLAAVFLAEVAVFQSRGLYLAVPAAAILVWILARPGWAGRPRGGLAAAFATGALGLALLLPLSPQGRLGPVSPWFTVSQLRTLQGQAGPGAGSYNDRIKWFHAVVGEVEARGTEGWLAGVGLGPDLIRGVSGTNATVRKPHDDYLEVFARLGLPALLVFLAMLWAAVLTVLKGARRAQGMEARLLWWIFAVAVLFLLIAATQPLLAFPYGTIPLFSLLGAGLAIAEDVRRRPVG